MVLTDSYSRVAASFMDADEAMELLGIENSTGSFAGDRKLILDLAKQYRTDLDQPSKEAKEKVLAITSLLSQFIQNKKQLPPRGESQSEPSYNRPSYSQQSESEDLPFWQTDSRSSNNSIGGGFRNINFCMKYIYEHALEAEGGDRSRLERIMVWSFDGVFSRGEMTVFGSRKIDPLMADVMCKWQPSAEAVLTSDTRGNFRVIWVEGHDVNIPVEHESFNKNAFNDRRFGEKIRDIVNQYK